MAKEFIAVKTVGEALAAKQAGGTYLAGGTEINRLDSTVHADTLISIRGIREMAEITVQEGDLCIGALCTFQQVIDCDLTPAWLAEACRFMASRTRRNMATIGGNIALARTDSYLVPLLIAVGAQVLLADGGSDCQAVNMLDYLGGSDCSADIEGKRPYADALIVCIKVPLTMAFVQSERIANTAQSHAALTVSFAVRESLDDVEMAAAVKNGGIYHLTDLAAAIREDHDVSEDKLVDMVKTCTGAAFPTDMFGSEAYKRYLLGVTVSGLLASAKKGGLS